MSNEIGKSVVIHREHFTKIFDALHSLGYQIVGPTVRDEAIIFDQIEKLEDLPIGWTDDQAPGSYRLRKRNDAAVFGFGVGPQSPKKFLYPSRLKLFSAQKIFHGFKVTSNLETNTTAVPQYAFIGVRPCELSAVAIHEKVLLEGLHADSMFKSFRDKAFFIVVNCTESGETCFCESMKTGPKSVKGFDIALTEVLKDGQHYFVAEIGSEKGGDVLKNVPNKPAEASQLKIAEEAVKNAAQNMGRTLKTDGIQKLLFDNLDHPEWDVVAKRCLTCTNCTLVCPTCFCYTVEDTTNLTGDTAERWRRLNSCFTLDFTKVAFGTFRVSAKSRYRQWMTHKLAGWYQQFGMSGCVGCGRCITWCPVGIDITAEVAAIQGDGSSRLNKNN